MESESLLKVTELLPVQQINTREINDNTENFITVKETGKNKKTKLNHRQDYLNFFPSKNARTNRNLMMMKTQYYFHLIMHLIKEDRKSCQLKTTNNRRLTLLTNNIKNPLNRENTYSTGQESIFGSNQVWQENLCHW